MVKTSTILTINLLLQISQETFILYEIFKLYRPCKYSNIFIIKGNFSQVYIHI